MTGLADVGGFKICIQDCVSRFRCSILMHPHIPVHTRGIHKVPVYECPLGCTVHHLACNGQPPGCTSTQLPLWSCTKWELY